MAGAQEENEEEAPEPAIMALLPCVLFGVVSHSDQMRTLCLLPQPVVGNGSPMFVHLC